MTKRKKLGLYLDALQERSCVAFLLRQKELRSKSERNKEKLEERIRQNGVVMDEIRQKIFVLFGESEEDV